MKGLNRKKIEQLAAVHEPECISVYIPTHRFGRAVQEQKDNLRLKNEIRHVKEALVAAGLSEDIIERKIKPIVSLVDDHDFWRHQSQGLAILASNEVFETFNLPFAPEPFNYVNSSFYLKPLIVNFTDGFNFYLLRLESDKVKLFEVTDDSITEQNLKDLMPLVLQETVGYDFKENNLQYRSVQKGSKAMAMHGYGAGKDDSDLEIQKFFRAVNKAILPELNAKGLPLVISGSDHLFAMYKKINSYKNLFAKHLPESLKTHSLKVIKLRAQELVAPLRREQRNHKIKDFKDKAYTEETAFDMKSIFKAIFNKKVDTLFLKRNYEAWGTYNPETSDLVIGRKHSPPNVELTNLAVVTLFLQGRSIYELKSDDMPFSSSSWNAILYQ
ncbi:hypothetical protein V8G61_07705 [Gaetbulibacter sp. M240]|uniref:baeRF7 domain-containing protein n=1 Tax=Gaetbulibacter sp. M240 TaxID=3126511 RepID=UPI00374EF06B